MTHVESFKYIHQAENAKLGFLIRYIRYSLAIYPWPQGVRLSPNKLLATRSIIKDKVTSKTWEGTEGGKGLSNINVNEGPGFVGDLPGSLVPSAFTHNHV